MTAVVSKVTLLRRRPGPRRTLAARDVGRDLLAICAPSPTTRRPRTLRHVAAGGAAHVLLRHALEVIA